MYTLFLQAGPPPHAEHGVNGIWIVFALIPLFLILAGTVLGGRALQDIRAAGGSLGGAWSATFAAGLLPALIIVIACGTGFALLGQPRRTWLLLGCGTGVWLSFLMMRAMHRGATGWTPPAASTAAGARSGLSTAAIVLTIVGSAISLLILLTPHPRLSRLFEVFFSSKNGLLIFDLAVLLAGLICGVLSRRETAGKACAWICGSLFAVLLILLAS